MLSAQAPARTLVSYDDIATPGAPASPSGASSPPGASGGGSADLPSKKRKRNNAYAHSHGQHSHGQRRAQSHWDDPTSQENGEAPGSGTMVVVTQATAAAAIATSGPPAVARPEEDEEDEEGRMLSYDEIWDDSALVDAWNAAQEEYEALNGPDKAWKKEPVHKSPLSWYNDPPSSAKGKAPVNHVDAEAGPSRQPNGASIDASAESDSQPVDFNTFVPSHDPSLSSARPPPASQSMPTAPFSSAPIVSRDEAFQNAMSAMYWSGYWTAAYHYQSQDQKDHGHAEPEAAEEEEEAEVEDEIQMGDEEDYVSTQR